MLSQICSENIIIENSFNVINNSTMGKHRFWKKKLLFRFTECCKWNEKISYIFTGISNDAQVHDKWKEQS